MAKHRDDAECEYLTLAQVARSLPPTRGGRPTHISTVTRWIQLGVKLADGSRAYLAADRFPGRWLVRPEKLEEFIAILTADRRGQPSSPAPSPARRLRAAEAAGRELDRIGI